VAVDIDDVLGAELAGETGGAAERLRGKPGQVIDVMGAPLCEQLLQHRVSERFGVEHLLQVVQRFISTRVLVKRGSGLSSVSSVGFSPATLSSARFAIRPAFVLNHQVLLHR
jgi:hypothetical protein